MVFLTLVASKGESQPDLGHRFRSLNGFLLEFYLRDSKWECAKKELYKFHAHGSTSHLWLSVGRQSFEGIYQPRAVFWARALFVPSGLWREQVCSLHTHWTQIFLEPLFPAEVESTVTVVWWAWLQGCAEPSAGHGVPLGSPQSCRHCRVRACPQISPRAPPSCVWPGPGVTLGTGQLSWGASQGSALP